MHQASKYLALALGSIALAIVLVVTLHHSRRPKTELDVQVAANTCTCYPYSSRILVLRISSRGELALNSEPVPSGQLALRLRQIYSTHAERVLYLFPENGTPPQRITDVIDTVRHLQSEKTSVLPAPKELQTASANMNIEVKLVTPEAVSSPCPKNCFNWATEGLPVTPQLPNRGSDKTIWPF